MSKESRKDWERPWTTEEIVEHADDWNLACDAALLNTLKALGDKILKKAEEVNDKIEDLDKNLSKIHLQVDLARNEFSSLRNTQFVECRVYEDDETLVPGKQEDEEKKSIVPEEETLDDLREAVALGLEILDEYYDKVDVTVSDSEGEEEDIPSYIYRRKDPYIDRRLPLVIGSEEWNKKWHVGLEDTDSENENSSETLSNSENEDNFSQNKDLSDVSSELSNVSGFNTSKVRNKPVLTTNVTQDLSASASSLDNSTDLLPKNLTFAEQLTAKLGNVMREKEAPLNEPEVNRRPIQKKPSDYGALFSSEPPPLDDIKTQESQGIFSGGKGLFDDEDDDDLWNPGKTKIPSISRLSSEPKMPDQVKDLFDDDSDDGIFSSKNHSITKQNKQPYIQSNKPLVPVFDEEPPLFDEEIDNKEKKKPKGGVSLFGKTDIFQGQSIGKILKERKPSTSESSNEDEPENLPRKEIKSSVKSTVNFANDEMKPNSQQNSSKQTISTVPQTKEPEKKKSMLFDDDIFSDDLFSSIDKKTPSGLFENSILFSDNDIVEPSFQSAISATENSSENISRKDESKKLPSSTVQSSEITNNKNSKSNDKSDNIFKSKSDTNGTKKQSETKKDSKNSEKIEKLDKVTNKTVKASLFDDLDDVDDLFSGISNKNLDEKKNKSTGFLFDSNEDDDFDIFVPTSNKNKSENVEREKASSEIQKSTKTEKTKEEDQKKRISKPKISLFDDDLDDIDDLFSQISNKNFTKQSLKSETPEKISDSVIKPSQSNPTRYEEKYEKNKIRNDIETVTEGLEHVMNLEKSVIKTDPVDKPTTTQKPVLESYATEKPLASVETGDNEISGGTLNVSMKKEDGSNNKEQINESIKNKEFPIKDEQNIPEISVEEFNKSAEINVHPSSSPPDDMNPPDIKSTDYKGSSNVPNVKFMDSIPPPDDDWDTNSDNTFDDLDTGNDGFQSQTSSLFDNEPPSLFFEDSKPIHKNPITDRLTPVTQEVPSDIFNNSFLTSEDGKVESNLTNSSKITESNDNSEFERDKNITEGINNLSVIQGDIEDSPHSEKIEKKEKILNPLNDGITPYEKDSKLSEVNSKQEQEQVDIQIETESTQNKTKAKPPITRNKPISSKENKNAALFDAPAATDPVIKSDSIFSDIIDKDENDFLFSSNLNQTNDSNNLKINKNIISDNEGNEKSVSFDDNSEDPTALSEPGVGADSDDNMQSNILKITEKLQQISNKHEERTKPLAVPRKLSHNLNINVGALLPGSALPKRGKTQSLEENENLSKSLPASRVVLNEEFSGKFNTPTSPRTIGVSNEDLQNKPDYKLEKSVSFDGSTDTEVLQSVTKDRVRIPVKRRPSSRRARQKSLRDSISEFRLDDPIPDEALTFDSEKLESVNTSANEQITCDKQFEETKKEKETFSNESTKEVIEKTGNLNDSEDDSHDLFKSIGKSFKDVNKANIISTEKKELFKDNPEELFVNTNFEVTKKIDNLFEDEDDLFGSKAQLPRKVHENQKGISSLNKNPDNKKSIFSDDDFKIRDNESQNDFLKGIENYSKSQHNPKKVPNVEKQPRIDNLFDSSDDEDIFKSTKNTVTVSKSAKDNENKNAPSISIIGKIAGNADSTTSNPQRKKSKPLFDFSDDEDFLQSLKTDNKKAEKKSTVKSHANLFDDMDDDDIFNISNAENKNKQDVKPSVINKRPPKSSSLRKLENIEANDDPLSALLK